MMNHQEIVWKACILRRILDDRRIDDKCVHILVCHVISDMFERVPAARRLSWYKGWTTPKPINRSMSLDIWRRLPTYFQKEFMILPIDSIPINEVRPETNDEPDEDDDEDDEF